MEPLVFLGATAVPEIAELVRDINAVDPVYEMRCILDDNEELHGTEIEGLPVTGGLETVAKHPDALFVFTIGSFRSRLRRYDVLQRLGLPEDRYATLIHPRGKVYSSATIGRGCIIHCGAVIGNGTRVGDFSIILWDAVIGADNLLGPGVLVTSNVTTNSSVRLGSFCFLGSASAIAEDVTVGPGALVGMGSLVMRDVPPGAVQSGAPPRILALDRVPEEIVAAWEVRIAAEDKLPGARA